MHYVSLAGFSASPWSESFGRGARRTASAWSRRCRVRRCRCAHATGTCHRRSMRPTRVQRRRSGHSGGERGSVRHGITASVPRARAGGTAIRDALHGLGGPARARSLDGSGADLGRGCGGGSSGSACLACLDRLGVDPVAAKREQAGKGRDGGVTGCQTRSLVCRDPRWAVRVARSKVGRVGPWGALLDLGSRLGGGGLGLLAHLAGGLGASLVLVGRVLRTKLFWQVDGHGVAAALLRSLALSAQSPSPATTHVVSGEPDIEWRRCAGGAGLVRVRTCAEIRPSSGAASSAALRRGGERARQCGACKYQASKRDRPQLGTNVR